MKDITILSNHANTDQAAREFRVCRDGSILILDDPPLQLSRQQLAIVATIHASGRCVSADLHRSLWKRNGEPYTASQRASMSRSIRRLCEQGVVERDGRRLKLSEYGAELAHSLTEIGNSE